MLPTSSHHCCTSSGPEDLFHMHNHRFWLGHLGRFQPHHATTVMLTTIQCTAFVHTWKQMILMRILLGIFMVQRSLVRVRKTLTDQCNSLEYTQDLRCLSLAGTDEVRLPKKRYSAILLRAYQRSSRYALPSCRLERSSSWQLEVSSILESVIQSNRSSAGFIPCCTMNAFMRLTRYS